MRDSSLVLAPKVLSGSVSLSEMIPTLLDSEYNSFLCAAAVSNTLSPLYAS